MIRIKFTGVGSEEVISSCGRGNSSRTHVNESTITQVVLRAASACPASHSREHNSYLTRNCFRLRLLFSSCCRCPLRLDSQILSSSLTGVRKYSLLDSFAFPLSSFFLTLHSYSISSAEGRSASQSRQRKLNPVERSLFSPQKMTGGSGRIDQETHFVLRKATFSVPSRRKSIQI